MIKWPQQLIINNPISYYCHLVIILSIEHHFLLWILVFEVVDGYSLESTHDCFCIYFKRAGFVVFKQQILQYSPTNLNRLACGTLNRELKIQPIWIHKLNKHCSVTYCIEPYLYHGLNYILPLVVITKH